MNETVATEDAAPFWANLEGLPSLMKALAEARRWAEQKADRVASAEALLQDRPEYKHYQLCKADLAEAKLQVDTLDAAVRKTAVDDFTKNGEKAVYAGVKIKMFTKVEYDAKQMRDWAKVNMTSLLALDTKGVEVAAKAGILEDAPITVTKEPAAFIDRDLSVYLGEAG